MIKVDNFYIGKFLNKIKSCNVVCFCAGQGLVDLCDKYEELVDRILYVVDNYKDTEDICIKGRKIPIISVEKIGEEIKDCTLIISTMQYAEEIIRQLDEISLLNGLSVYIPTIFKGDETYIEFGNSKHTYIPKKIHYCWFGKSEMPERFLANIDTWKKHCPEYEIICWNEDNYDVTKNEYMKQAYEAKKWGFVPDYARLDIVNEHGGIYLDTDVELLKSLDELLQYELFCGFESVNRVAFGLGFGAKKDNKILQDMMEVYDNTNFRYEDGTYNLTASPIYQTQVLEKYGLCKNGTTQLHKDFIALSPEYFSPISEYGFGHPTIHSFSIHQYAATWFNEEQKAKKDRFIKNCQYVMRRLGEEGDGKL